jgi:crotonobetainyl-CoA:carnitine CoA-transferase CaiB-like acyl-CoA transferase
LSGPALDGILVVALEQAVAAPYCTSRLADAGARVIKVERPEGDFARYYDRDVHGESTNFVWLNRGKESIALDIKKADDAALLARMIACADVFVQNLAPGAAARAGFGSAALRKRHPRLIACDISGYGEEGPYARMKAYDLLVQAESGLAAITGGPESPARVGVSVCDIACGLNAQAAILEALIARERSGEGRAIAVSLFDAVADWMNVPLLAHDYAGAAPARVGLRHPFIHPYRAYRAKEGPPVLIAIQNEREFAAFCREVLERAELASDPRFRDNPARAANADALDAIIEGAFGNLDRATLIARLEKAGIAYGAVNEVADLSRHPALRRIEVGSPSGPVRLAAPPARDDGPARRYRPVPALDEHGPALREEFGPA